MGFISRSKAHVQEADGGYFRHQRFAFKYGLQCFKAGFMAIIHALIPAFFETSASDTVKKLARACDKDCREL